MTVLQAELTRCGDALARCQGERDTLQGQISNDVQAVADKQALEEAVKKQVGLTRKYTVHFSKQWPLCEDGSYAVWVPTGPVRPGHTVPTGAQTAARRKS